jgi:ABC-type transporter Mla maintaining outer membrane lipid asymmetry ATPase subunit MlaF
MENRTHEPRPIANEAATSTDLALEMIDVTVGSLKDTEQVVLENVNWSVGVGDYWVIGGLQASGKSDFMATAAGIMRPLRGIHRVFGQELSAGFEEEQLRTRLLLGLVFDGGRLFNHLTLAENISLPIRYHQRLSLQEALAKTEALLELIELADRATTTPGTLGRNWQQRVGLARALALKPRILLLDNPLTGLDPRDVSWWLDLLDRLSAGHPTVDGQPMTLAATSDDLRPWKGRARQFALLRGKTFVPANDPNVAVAADDAWLHQVLGVEPLKK